MTKSFKPIGENVFVELTETTNKTAGGIILTREKREQSGKIVEIGTQVKSKDLKVGQKIYFNLGEFKRINLESEKEYAVVPEAQILGIYGDCD